MEKGTQWIYEGKVEWRITGSAIVSSTNLIWQTEVVDSIANSNARVAVVRGFPGELAWYEPRRTPGFCVLVNISNCVYRLSTRNEEEAKTLVKGFIAGTHEIPSTEQLFALPLAKGKRWGGDTERDDNYYCWNVEKEKTNILRVKGMARRRAKIYSVAYRTRPDHQILEIAPGVGILRYVFVHHGTVATTDVRLVSVTHSR